MPRDPGSCDHDDDTSRRTASESSSSRQRTLAERPLHSARFFSEKLRLNRGRRPTNQAVPPESPQYAVAIARSLSSVQEIRCCRIWHFAATRPAMTAAAALLFVGLSVLIGMLAASPKVETTFAAENQADEKDVRKRKALDAALQMRLPGTPLFKKFDVHILYERKNGADFNHDAFMQVAEFEQRLRALSEWQRMCSEAAPTDQPLCSFGLSFVNYALPTHIPPGGSVVPTGLKYDGRGSETLPMQSVRAVLDRHNLSGIVLPTHALTSTSSNLAVLRSSFRFRFPCCTSNTSDAAQTSVLDRLNKDWKKLLEESLLPFLREPEPSGDKTWPLRVWFSIDNSDKELEVLDDVMQDVDFCVVGSFFVILVYMVFHTRNIVMTLAGTSLLTLSPLFAYCFFGIFTQSRELNVVSIAVLFPVLGIGTNTLFLYTDAWQEATERGGTEEECLRMTWSKTALRSCCAVLISALTLIAMLPAASESLREVAGFLCLVIILQWVAITGIYVPLCAVDERHFRRFRLCRCCYSDPGGSPDARRTVANAWANFIRPLRIFIVWATSLVFLSLGIAALVLARMEDTVPQTFPAIHNENRGRDVMKMFREPSSVFRDGFAAPPSVESVCSEQTAFSGSQLGNCSLFWCEGAAQAGAAQASSAASATCTCFAKDTLCHPNGSALVGNISVVQRFVGLSLAQLSAGAHFWHLPSGKTPVEATRLNRLQPLLLQQWETGNMRLEAVIEATTLCAGSAGHACDTQQLCYCGMTLCVHNGFHGSGVGIGASWGSWSSTALQLPTNVSAAPGYNRWPMASGSTTTGSASVTVVVGIDVIMANRDKTLEFGSLWDFSSGFNPGELWAQRALYKLCRDVPQELKVVHRTCWMENFKQWVVDGQKARFPVPENSFQPLVRQFMQHGNNHRFRDFLWERNGVVVAYYAVFGVDVKPNATQSEVSALKLDWNSYLSNWDSSAPGTAKAAWHTSTLWLQSQTATPTLSGLLASVVLATTIAMVGTAAVTCSIIFALCAALAVLICYFILLFFLAVAMDRKIGFVEIAAIVAVLVFVSSYSIHLVLFYSHAGSTRADEYDDEDEAFGLNDKRTNRALSSVGAATLGSCVVAFCCSCFLCGGFLPIFRHVGQVTILGIPLAASVSLAFLPAALELSSSWDDWIRCMLSRSARNVGGSTGLAMNPSFPFQSQPYPEPMPPSVGEPYGQDADGASIGVNPDAEHQGQTPEPREVPPPIAHEVIMRLPNDTQHIVGRSEAPKVTAAVTQAAGGSSVASRNAPGQWQASLL